VAAQLSEDNQLDVHRQRGGLGELRVVIDGHDVVDSNRFFYPTPTAVVRKVQAYLATSPPAGP
jgi:hypothetical protein